MKRFLSIALVCALGLGLCACGSEIKEDLYQKEEDLEKDTEEVAETGEENTAETADVKEA